MKKDDDYFEEIWTGTCGNCDGTGMEECPVCEGEGDTYDMDVCEYCDGEGYVKCSVCDGEGEATYRDGQVIRKD